MFRELKIKHKITLLCALLLIAASAALAAADIIPFFDKTSDLSAEKFSIDISGLPEFDGKPYTVLNNNQPSFSDKDLTTSSYEKYSDLDSLGRCGYAMACIGKDLMPTQERESIGEIKPSGWHTVKYDIVDGRYLYNRCHLIGFQLTGENTNVKNLITGTRFMNTEGMLPFENMVADYIKETDNHVLFRVTPIFYDQELVARGVQMEAYSIEDNGDGICFNVYIYNCQPGIQIDYLTGASRTADDNSAQNSEAANNETTYILNTNTKKFHLPECGSSEQISQQNRSEYHGTRDALIQNGYEPCKICNP